MPWFQLYLLILIIINKIIARYDIKLILLQATVLASIREMGKDN